MADTHAAASTSHATNAASTRGEGGAMPHTGEHAATTAADEGHGTPHAEPAALGLDATAWVALAMLVVIGIMLWKKVPAAIGKSLDNKIAAIREQLDEASRLRAEAETLRGEYEAKSAAAGAEAEAMLERARHEAEGIRAQAEADAANLIERRTRMAEAKIAAAAAAAERLIRERHDAAADSAMIDRTIEGLGRTH
jgi:F-type H+-transporting ATPase subunit b